MLLFRNCIVALKPKGSHKEYLYLKGATDLLLLKTKKDDFSRNISMCLLFYFRLNSSFATCSRQ